MKKILFITFIMMMFTANIAFGISIVDVACGESHTVLLAEDGTVWTMGDNSKGQCGSAEDSTIYVPKQIKYIPKITKITAAGNGTMLLDENGCAYILQNNSLTPCPIKNVVDIAMGVFFHSNNNGVFLSADYLQYGVLTASGEVYTMGYSGNYSYNAAAKPVNYYDLGRYCSTAAEASSWGLVTLPSTGKLPVIKDIFFCRGLGCIDDAGYMYYSWDSSKNCMKRLSGTVTGAKAKLNMTDSYFSSNRPYLNYGASNVYAIPSSITISSSEETISGGDIIDIISTHNNTTKKTYYYDGQSSSARYIFLTKDGAVYEAQSEGVMLKRNYGIYSKKIVKAAMGANHTILLDEKGNVYGYGENSCGQLGITTPQEERVEVLESNTYNLSTETYLSVLMRKGDLVKMASQLLSTMYNEYTIDIGVLFGGDSYYTIPTLIESLQEIVPSGQSSLAYITSDARVWIGGIVNFSLMFEVGEDMTLRNTGNNLQDIFTNGALNIKVYDWNKVNGQDVQITSAQGLVYNVYENGVNITQTITPNFVFKSGKVYQLECGIGGAEVFVERGKTYTIKFEGMNASKVKDGVVTQMRSTVDIAKFVLRVYVTELANLT